MKSPFPGMDPYLEQHWLDVHHALATYARDQLQRKLPRDLRARIEERVFVETDDEGQYRGIHPDVRIVEHLRPVDAGTPPEGGLATAEWDASKGTHESQPMKLLACWLYCSSRLYGPRNFGPLKWIMWSGISAIQTSVSQAMSAAYLRKSDLSRNAVT